VYLSALQILADIAYNSWQRKWECDSSGYYTRHVVSRAGTRLVFSWWSRYWRCLL